MLKEHMEFGSSGKSGVIKETRTLVETKCVLNAHAQSFCRSLYRYVLVLLKEEFCLK